MSEVDEQCGLTFCGVLYFQKCEIMNVLTLNGSSGISYTHITCGRACKKTVDTQCPRFDKKPEPQNKFILYLNRVKSDIM